MMSTKIITTFSKDGYELYGKKMVNTWLQYWPSTFELIVYTEEFKLLEKDSRLKEIDIDSACPSLIKFKNNSLQFIDNKDKKSKRRIDKAIRWSHKVYAISHALQCKCDYLIFLDGDTYSKKQVDVTLPNKIVGNHLFGVHFETIKNSLHFETGFICFNMNHPQINILKNELQKGYDNLEIYSLQKPWDGFWFSYLYQKFNLDVINLGSGVFSNPLIKDSLVHEVGKSKFNNSIKYDKYSGLKKR